MKIVKIILCVLLISLSLMCLANDVDYLNEKEKKDCFKLEDKITNINNKYKENYEKIENEYNKKLIDLEKKYNKDSEEYKVEVQKIESEKENKINKEKENEEKDKSKIENDKKKLEDNINTRLRRDGIDAVININNILFGIYNSNSNSNYNSNSNSKIKVTRNVRTTGMAAVINHDEASAKDKAILDCQVKALEEVVGVFVDSEITASNFTEIDEKIYKNVKGYIESCKPDETSLKFKDYDGYKSLFISCDCVVNVNQVFDSLQDIKTLYNKVGKPKFVVIAKSSTNNNFDFCPAIETVFINKLKELNFDAVDSTALQLQRSELDNNIKSYYSTFKENGIKLAFVIDLQLDEKSSKLLEHKNKNIWDDLIGLINKKTEINVNINIKLIDIKSGGVYFSRNFNRTSKQLFAIKNNKSNEVVDDMLYDFFHKDVDELKTELFNKWVELSSDKYVNLSVKNIDYSDAENLLKAIEEQERFFKNYTDKKFENNELTVNVHNSCSMSIFIKTLENININGKKLHIIGVNDSEEIITTELGDFILKPVSKVEENIKIESIKLNKPSLTMKKGYKCTLKPLITPKNATNKDIEWQSADPSIAVVDENGCVIGLKKGTTVILAITKDGNKIATCAVTIN